MGLEDAVRMCEEHAISRQSGLEGSDNESVFALNPPVRPTVCSLGRLCPRLMKPKAAEDRRKDQDP
jgi:hypothetical protein